MATNTNPTIRLIPTSLRIRPSTAGHTDSVGSDTYNQALSERRASSVAAYMLGMGLAPNKLTSEGRGESQPVADNETDEGRAKNRRVELHINR